MTHSHSSHSESKRKLLESLDKPGVALKSYSQTSECAPFKFFLFWFMQKVVFLLQRQRLFQPVCFKGIQERVDPGTFEKGAQNYFSINSCPLGLPQKKHSRASWSLCFLLPFPSKITYYSFLTYGPQLTYGPYLHRNILIVRRLFKYLFISFLHDYWLNRTFIFIFILILSWECCRSSIP